MFVFLYPDPVTGSSLRTAGASYSSLHPQLPRRVHNTICARCTLAGSLRIFTHTTEAGCRESWPLVVASAKWQGCWWCPQPFLPRNKHRSMSVEDGTPPPPAPDPFRGESSLCPCLERVFPSFERRTFLKPIFKLKSSRTKAARQLWPRSPAPLPLQPRCHYCLMGEGCEGFRRNIWSGPLSAGETETSQLPI